MKIVVIGGSGLIGTKLVNNLRQHGHEVVPASPSSGVNTITGEGLAKALRGAQVVVDVSNAPSWEDEAVLEFFETSGRNLLAAEAAAGVGHHVALSVVGTDRLLASGYFRAKMAQENLITASGIPYTIVRATQFFEFMGGIAQFSTVGQTVHLPPVLAQPIAADDVASALAEITLAAPVNGMIEIAGPERAGLDELVGRFLGTTKDPRAVITDVDARYYGLVVSDQSLTPGADPRIGATFFEDWLNRYLTQKNGASMRESSDSSASPNKPAVSDQPLKPTVKPPSKRRRWPIVVGTLVAAVLLFIGIPLVIRALNTISTDDAYVNGYVTFVAPRVSGQVARVLVDDNNRVKKGDVLLELDPKPYQVQVAIKQAAVDNAQANLVLAQANVRGLIGQARSNRFKLARAIEDVDNQAALIRARVATWEQKKATLVLAQQEFDRAERLLASKVVSQEEYDERREALGVAKAQVVQALENVYQARVALGLPAQPPEGKTLADVPEDLDQTFSSVLQAQADLRQSAAELGVVPSSYNLTPKQMLEEFQRRDPGGNLDRIYAKIVNIAPSLKVAETNLVQAQSDLDQAKLNLSYCTVFAEIDGVVTRRNVNPGNNLQAGQSVMAIRSLRDIWVDANFKETQLRNLRIGQHVDLELDIYGGKHIFEARISGFTMGTGSTLALLPAQNATGNFVKVVQRLPVRIDVLNYDPDKLPLFVGLSVTPTVDLRIKPTGPNAGKFLQALEPNEGSASPKTP